MKISVCMATYNGEKYLKQQLDSILEELSHSDEVIISDDGSTDNTLKIILGYKDERIKLVHSGKKNLIRNFENALNLASGDIIFLSDQDDIWKEGKVEKCKKILKDHILVFSNASVFKDDHIETSKPFFISSTSKTGLLKNLYKSNYIGATMAFRKSILNRALPFPKDLAMHDIWLGLIAESKGSTYYVNEPLIFYRRHQGAVSTTAGQSKFSFFKKIKIRLKLIINLLLRVLRLK